MYLKVNFYNKIKEKFVDETNGFYLQNTLWKKRHEGKKYICS